MGLEKYFEDICQVARDVLAQNAKELSLAGLVVTELEVRTVEGFSTPELVIHFHRNGNLENIIERFALENNRDPMPLDWWRDLITADLMEVIAAAQKQN